eukprot:jgi/Ulvmu1/10637/UM066_0017.1
MGRRTAAATSSISVQPFFPPCRAADVSLQRALARNCFSGWLKCAKARTGASRDAQHSNTARRTLHEEGHDDLSGAVRHVRDRAKCARSCADYRDTTSVMSVSPNTWEIPHRQHTFRWTD